MDSGGCGLSAASTLTDNWGQDRLKRKWHGVGLHGWNGSSAFVLNPILPEPFLESMRCVPCICSASVPLTSYTACRANLLVSWSDTGCQIMAPAGICMVPKHVAIVPHISRRNCAGVIGWGSGVEWASWSSTKSLKAALSLWWSERRSACPAASGCVDNEAGHYQRVRRLWGNWPTSAPLFTSRGTSGFFSPGRNAPWV